VLAAAVAALLLVVLLLVVEVVVLDRQTELLGQRTLAVVAVVAIRPAVLVVRVWLLSDTRY
jgi:hypothetical protein